MLCQLLAPTTSSAQPVPDPKCMRLGATKKSSSSKPELGPNKRARLELNAKPPVRVTTVRAIRSAGRPDHCSRTLRMLLSMDPVEVLCFVPAAQRDVYADKLQGLSCVIVADNEGPSEVVTAMCSRALKLDGDVHLIVHDDNLASWRLCLFFGYDFGLVLWDCGSRLHREDMRHDCKFYDIMLRLWPL